MFPRPVIIAYDIRSGKTRRNVLRILKEWRLDGQKSVHECLLNRPQAEELFIQLGSAIDAKSDRLLMAWVDSRRNPLARGKGRNQAMQLRHP